MAGLTIRRAEPDEFDAIGKLCVEAYAFAGIAEADSEYGKFLSQVSPRADSPNTEVWAAFDGDELVGTATMCAFGSPLTEVCVEGEMEPRTIAVAPSRQREGIAEQLINASIRWAQDHELTGLAVCVVAHNPQAERIYRRLGFQRKPERDLKAFEGTPLQTYTLNVSTGFCPRCGDPHAGRDHSECVVALELEPPRYCPECRRRMVVQIVPTGFRATCSRHGEIGS